VQTPSPRRPLPRANDRVSGAGQPRWLGRRGRSLYDAAGLQADGCFGTQGVVRGLEFAEAREPLRTTTRTNPARRDGAGQHDASSSRARAPTWAGNADAIPGEAVVRSPPGSRALRILQSET
jgi:hypothetical protein